MELNAGDNGIFLGLPISKEESALAKIAQNIYKNYSFDGKYILDNNKLIICQSNVSTELLKSEYPNAIINPLGDWTGGINVDTGCVNRKLGSDLGKAVTGGGIHGKDCSKADVSANIVCYILAQKYNKQVQASCAIGDLNICFKIGKHKKLILTYTEITEMAFNFIQELGGFEKLAE